MATEKRQRVRFTGKRTGLESIAIKGIGIIQQGDVIEVSLEEAERWTAELPMRDDKTGSDFVKSGGPISVDKDEVAQRLLKQQEKIAAKHEDDVDELTVANTELAHGDDGTGDTAEEEAKEQREDAEG
jgi:hypothetical protein